MKVEKRFFVCGVTCFMGGENCNNYCNHNKNAPMPDSPATFDTLVMEEIDMWKDVIDTIVEFIPTDKTIFQILESKYTIAPKNNYNK